MNESTRKILIEYAIVAMLGFALEMWAFISTGVFFGVEIFYYLFSAIMGGIFCVGYYQCLIVDYLGFTSFSLSNILLLFGRICESIGRSISNDSFVWFFIKFIIFLLFGWIIGDIRAILRIKRSLDE